MTPSEVGQTTEKVSLPFPNVANNILNWLNERWPDLPMYAAGGFYNVWATGSNVWSHLYDLDPPKSSDLDLFVCANTYEYTSGGLFSSIYKRSYEDPKDKELKQIEAWAAKLEGARKVDVPHRKMTTSLGGKRYYTERGNLDIWKSSHVFVRDQLASYPKKSHAHCRAAINLYTTELVIMPNTKATKDGAFADLERKALINYMEKADALRKSTS